MVSRTSPAPPLPAAPRPRARGPWWVGAARVVSGTVRDLRGQSRPAGLRMVAGPDGMPMWEAVPRGRRRPARVLAWAWRWRRQLAPVPVTVGYAALAAAHPGDARVTVWLLLAAPVFAAAVWAAVLNVGGGSDRTHATWAVIASTIGALEVWCVISQVSGDRWVPAGAVWGIGAAGVAASTRRFRIRPHDLEPTMMNDLDTPWQIRRWEEYVSPRGGVLPGAAATFLGDVYAPEDPEPDGTEPDEGKNPSIPHQGPIGFRLAVDLVRGRHELTHLTAKAGVLAGVYDAEKAGTVVDAVGSEVRALLTFTTRVFLNEVKVWRRPTLDLHSGRFVIVTLADGTSGHWQAWIPRQGVRHGWIIGATGGGKSGAIDCVLANTLSAGIAVADLVDLKGGASVPHWRYRVLRYGTTPAEGVAALRRAVLICDYRNARMARMQDVDPDTLEPVFIDGQPALGRTWVDPSEDWPIYEVLIEEWPQLVCDPVWGALALALAERVAALGRQALVMFVPTSQGANLDVAFGGSRVLRSNIQAGNVLVLWTDQGTGNLATATRSIDLSRIPEGVAGVGYMVGPGQHRDLLGRGSWVRRKWDAVEAARPGRLTDQEAAVFDAADNLHAGIPLPDVRAAALAEFPGDPEWADIVNEILGDPDCLTPTALPDAGPDGQFAWGGPLHFGDPDPDGALSESQRRLLTVLAAGERSTADLRAALGGITDQALRRHLNGLLADELVERAGHGRYRLITPEPAPDIPDVPDVDAAQIGTPT